MMKKQYIQPEWEIVPFCAMTALCESGGGDTNETIGGNHPSGGNPWTGGMAPTNPRPF